MQTTALPQPLIHRLGLLVVAITLVSLTACLLAPRSQAAFPGENGRIAFQSNRDGNWEIYRECWPELRRTVQKAWVNLSLHAIEGTPIAWGNERDVERGIRVRGLVRVACDGCVNGFLERSRRVVSAAAVTRAMRSESSVRRDGVAAGGAHGN